MGDDYLGPKVKTEVDSYIATLTDSEKENFGETERTALLKSMFNPVEDWINGIVSISSGQTIADGSGNLTIIIPSSVTADFTIYLPIANNSVGQKIRFINLSDYKITIYRQSSDTIEGVLYYELFSVDSDYQLEFISIGSNSWKRTDVNMVLIPESDRPSSWVLNGGPETSYTNVDFSNYAPYGVKALLLKVVIYSFNRNDGEVKLRKNGSSVTNDPQITSLRIYQGNASVTDTESRNQFIVNCDSEGIINYRVTGTNAYAYLNIEGYFI